MWWNQQNTPRCALPRLSMSDILVAARADTDHTTGSGKVAIKGRFDSRKESFDIDAAYALDDTHTVYASYGVTDEKLTSVGWESGFNMFGRRNTLDMVYSPPTDSAMVKLAVRQGKVKLSTLVSFPNFKTSNCKEHVERYELDAKLSPIESLRLTFDGKSKASKIKVTRKLDPKNRVDAEYNYASAAQKYVSMTFKHYYSKAHTFGITANYGSRNYRAEWECNTENGPWTVSTSFPFNASPHKGDWQIKRRFEF